MLGAKFDFTTLLGPCASALSCSQHGSPRFRRRSSISWQCIPDRQQTCCGVIENQTIRLYISARMALQQKIIHGSTTLTDGSVKLSALDA